jgi:amino acid adenylation domain-containing protein
MTMTPLSLELLADYPRPNGQSCADRTVPVCLTTEEVGALKTAAARLKVTPAALLQAAFHVLLIRASARDLMDDGPPEEREFHEFIRKGDRPISPDLALVLKDGEEDRDREGLELAFRYHAGRFKPRTVDRVVDIFKRIIAAAVGEDPRQKIADIDLLSARDRAQILGEFNHTRREYPVRTTIHALFADQAARTPRRTALVWPSLSGTGRVMAACDSHVSYDQLQRYADRLARQLRQEGLGSCDIVGLMVERSIEMMVGILAVLKTGGAYLPIDPGFPPQRRDYILTDSGADIVLSDHPCGSLGRLFRVEQLLEDADALFQPGQADSWSPAYVLYTSGSTGRPKGVVVTHRSVLNILYGLSDAFPQTAAHRSLLKTSFLFDVSVTELFGWILDGSAVVLLEKDGEKEPGIMLKVIETVGITHINFVPAMFNVFLDCLDSRDIARLSGLQYIFLAGEALGPDTVNRFRNLNTPVRLENLYGPTEGTVYASCYSLSAWKGEGRIPIGRPLPNIRLYILDGCRRLQPVGLPGELCIAGEGVAPGYLNNPQLTADKFMNAAAKTREETRSPTHKIPTPKSYILNPNRLYRTGDLARFLPDGNIEYLGRIDSQVKIRGFRVELGEIESVLRTHPAIKEAVLVTRPDPQGCHTLHAYILPTNRTNPLQLRQYLSRTLPDYMIPAHFIRLEQLPLTPSGKIDRLGLPQPAVRANKNLLPPRDDLEERLIRIWADVLGQPLHSIGLDANLFEGGGHSIKVIAFISRLYNECKVRLPFARVFELASLGRISDFIKKQKDGVRRDLLVPVEEREYPPASYGQVRVWTLSQWPEASLSFNIPALYYLEGEPDQEGLAFSLERLAARHESLRTVFKKVDGEVRQKIRAVGEIPVPLAYVDWRQAEDKPLKLAGTVAAERNTPFDLTAGPLLRCRLLHLETKKWICLFTLHHIIGDYLSCKVLARDLWAYYRAVVTGSGEPLEPLKIQYKDYAAYHRGCLLDDGMTAHRDYWLGQLLPPPPPLNLPLDRPRPRVQTFGGETIYFSTPPSLKAGLAAIARQNSATLFMTLLAVVFVFLYRYTRQEDLVVGFPFAGRDHPALENQIGFFLNTLAIRSPVNGADTFLEVLGRVSARTLAAFAHQVYPFDRIVEELDIPRDISRHPLFDVVVDMMDFSEYESRPQHPRLELSCHFGESGQGGDDQARITGIEAGKSKFDLTIFIFERQNHLDFAFEYNTALFERPTIWRMCRRFRMLMKGVCRTPSCPIADLAVDEEVKLPLIQAFKRN